MENSSHGIPKPAETEHHRPEVRREAVLAFKHTAEAYLDGHAPQAPEYLYALKESDRQHEVELEPQPDYALLMPIAADEAEENIRSTLDAIIEHPYQRPEVILYGNYTKETTEEEKAALEERLERILPDYRDTPVFSALRSIVIDTRYFHDFSMVQLRKEASDMLAADALERGLPFNYPVVTIDADAERLGNGTLESLVKPIQEEGVMLTYGDSNLGGYGKVSDSTEARLAASAEIIRRMEVRSGTEEEPYPEESCTAYSLGAYCMGKGYPPLIFNTFDKSNLVGETPKLIEQMELINPKVYKLMVERSLGYAVGDTGPQHVDNALVTRNGRRELVHFRDELAEAAANPKQYTELIYMLQESTYGGPPLLDRHISTGGGGYMEGFNSRDAMRENNGVVGGQRAVSKQALKLVLKSHFGSERMKLLETAEQDTTSQEVEKPAGVEEQSATDRKLHIEQMVLKRYFKDLI